MTDDTRTIEVTATWRSVQTIEIPADHPTIAESDLEAVLEIEDVTAAGAELTDWEVRDRGARA